MRDIEEATDCYGEICYNEAVYDRSTGVYYLGVRYYDPENVRFLTRDSYRGDNKNPATLYLYVYCANNPIAYEDPDGHIAVSRMIGGIVGGVAGAWIGKKIAKKPRPMDGSIEALSGGDFKRGFENGVIGSVIPGKRAMVTGLTGAALSVKDSILASREGKSKKITVIILLMQL
ncbi:RHS repeat-associated core domain-containing protein [Faecalicatena contorta]|uniref:RHS repeat-associated core domain-containing protein n=1 Tax=Faecalicatena contorta TaxID=39482 RepID=UPI001F1D02D0|nr:RHS repeat-associated core domain-containing protein [Faecalicatena contorta]MCF2682022.1 RHS repeat-associated core domain-containing protein [Faecalicatena contorta]